MRRASTTCSPPHLHFEPAAAPVLGPGPVQRRCYPLCVCDQVFVCMCVRWLVEWHAYKLLPSSLYAKCLHE
jgi:hypothetical protein